jgi:hypothetical protein
MHTNIKIVQRPVQTNASPRPPSVRIGTESSTDHHVFAEYHGRSAAADVECLVTCVADECYGTGGVTDGECVVADNTSCMS